MPTLGNTSKAKDKKGKIENTGIPKCVKLNWKGKRLLCLIYQLAHFQFMRVPRTSIPKCVNLK